MQSIIQILLRKTLEAIWRRGEEYADSGKVHIVKSDDKEIEAVVKGTQEYTVALKFRKSGMKAECSCPYAEGICKHIIAVAIVWDELHGLKRPNQDVVKAYSVGQPPISRREVKSLYSKPLKADLEKIRIMGDYLVPSSKRHAVLPKMPKIDTDVNKPLELIEVKDAFKEMETWARRPLYHHYFCGGEMAAAFSELLEVIGSRLKASSSDTSILIMANSVDWFYRGFNHIVDGSDGEWIFPQVRIGKIVAQLCEKHPDHPAWQDFNRIVKEVGDWWGEPGLDADAVAEWMHGKL